MELLKEFNINTFYLFGSASRGKLREDSDIDLAF
ncbi:MAG: nucleotidyltransferase domain-containing protein [Turicibacter sp.]